MISPLDWLSNKATSPATRIISGIVSLGLVGSIFVGIIPKDYMTWAFGFLALHIVNQLYFAFTEFKIPICHRCGKVLKPKTITTYPKHICKIKNIQT